jgi:hypothetical protein
MNKYVVAFINFHNNELLMEVIYANSKLEAAISYCNDFTDWNDVSDYRKLSTLQSDLFGGDCLIEVLDLNNKSSVKGAESIHAGLND